MSRATDVVVVGLGAVGSAVFYQLAKRGLSVIGLDRFYPPHDQGSSHGETRITRLSVGEGETYMPLVRRSHDIWRDLEAQTGKLLFNACGLLILEHPDQVALHHGKPQLLQTSVRLAQQHGVVHEVLSAQEVSQRFGAFTPPPGTQGYFEPQAGYLDPEACISAQLELGASMGAQVVGGQTARHLRSSRGAIEVVTQDETYHAHQVIVCAGAWMPQLLPATLGCAVKVYRQVFHWFEAAQPELYLPSRFPAFIWPYGAAPGQYLYGFPSPDPRALGVKLGAEQYHLSTSAETLNRHIAPQETAQMWTRHVRPHLRGLSGRCLRSKACMYATTPDGDFIVDDHPDMPGVTIVSACSGHGFKHSAGLGEALADQVQGRPTPDLSRFRLARLDSSSALSL